MKKLNKVLIMAGGTGGHIFPGLAVAKQLLESGVEVHWLGTEHGMEARLIPNENIPIHFISIAGLRGKGIKPLLLAPFKITNAIWQAVSVLRTVEPDVVLGFGGFASGPGGIASKLLGCPLVIHEQNAKAGLTNKLLANLAKKVLLGFPGAFPLSSKVEIVGNPVRSEIVQMAPPAARKIGERSPRRWLVLGGSLGAQALNDRVPKALATFAANDRPEVWHQTGDKHFETAKLAYKASGVEANVVPFISNMAEAYAWADVVLCRAGALTVAELCAAGLGAVFVPYPHAVDDHQTANATFMVNHQAARCIQQSALTEDCLADIVREFNQSPNTCLVMAEAAYALRQPKVVERIIEICREVCR
ncbi:MAG: undecaprenyldiphospho-muramoylpentapeptide beta-N-acetylglucosaminyltransferase [Gammaproteobacteria bacterium]